MISFVFTTQLFIFLLFQKIDAFEAKDPQQLKLDSEYMYWLEQETDFSVLLEQLQSRVMKKVFYVLKEIKSHFADDLISLREVVERCHQLSNQNRQFLFTLLKPMKV